ncbi:hypothetical protein DFJ73DRAFT_921454 [Zopfochytrium polystomum]|nr:hypothetical protein DFJ73DRAFT_921454 [Zopfochytrium polystomum]
MDANLRIAILRAGNGQPRLTPLDLVTVKRPFAATRRSFLDDLAGGQWNIPGLRVSASSLHGGEWGGVTPMSLPQALPVGGGNPFVNAGARASFGAANAGWPGSAKRLAGYGTAEDIATVAECAARRVAFAIAAAAAASKLADADAGEEEVRAAAAAARSQVDAVAHPPRGLLRPARPLESVQYGGYLSSQSSLDTTVVVVVVVVVVYAADKGLDMSGVQAQAAQAAADDVLGATPKPTTLPLRRRHQRVPPPYPVVLVNNNDADDGDKQEQVAATPTLFAATTSPLPCPAITTRAHSAAAAAASATLSWSVTALAPTTPSFRFSTAGDTSSKQMSLISSGSSTQGSGTAGSVSTAISTAVLTSHRLSMLSATASSVLPVAKPATPAAAAQMKPPAAPLGSNPFAAMHNNSSSSSSSRTKHAASGAAAKAASKKIIVIIMDSWVVRKGNSLVKVPIAAAAAAAAVTTTSPAAPSTPQSSPSTTAASATTTNSRASPSPTADTTNGNNSTASATDETPFRFVSFNVPNLFYLEDRPNATTGERLGPTLFEQQDAVATIAYLRGSPAYHVAANITAFNGTKWSPIPNTANPRLYLNEDLFAALDSAVAIAHNHSVRLIIPFIDRWAWWGGIEAFASLHAKPLGNATTAAPDFFTDPTVTANFFALVTAVVNRTNNAGSPPRRYCEDPAILAWETGNELQTLSGGRVPANWTLAVARTVKDVLRTVPVDRIGAAGVAPGSQQLVLDGSDGARTGWQEEVLDDPDVDLFAGHYYDFVMAPAAAGSDEEQGPVGWPVVVTAVATAIGVMLVLVLWMKPQWIVPSTTRKQKRQSLARVERRDTSQDRLADDEAMADETRRGDQPLDNLFLQAVSQSSPSTADTTTTTPCPPNPPPPLPLPTDLATITPHRKPFLVGEFGLTATSNVRDLLTAVTTANASCVGAMLWSLRFRARDGGFYVHDEGGGYEAYHDRGGAGMGAGVVRAAGFGADEGAVMALMRGAAAAVSGVSNASLAVVPAPPPVVLRTGNATTVANGTAVVGVRWRGSVGAARYRVERSVVGAAEGFVVVTEDGSEAEAMLVDEVGAGVKAAWYRVTGWSSAGYGEMSEAVRLV